MTTNRNADGVSRALRNIREYGEAHRQPTPITVRPEAAPLQETTLQDAPGEAAGDPVGVTLAE
jgi:hypothetical protein